MSHQLDILAFAPHPDDAELFCGGLIAKVAALGQRTGIADLTRGELSSNGTLETRSAETQAASAALNLTTRVNLNLPDGALKAGGGVQNEQLAIVVDTIRELKPKIVLLPYQQDRHPDHQAASLLVKQALFFATLKNFAGKKDLAPFTVQTSLHYQLRFAFKPSFVVDISNVYEKKRAAIACYDSQISRQRDKAATLINSPLSVRSIEARDMYYGAMIGVEYAEPYYSESTLSVENPVDFFRAANPLLFPGD